jgi:hypothetical protein
VSETGGRREGNREPCVTVHASGSPLCGAHRQPMHKYVTMNCLWITRWNNLWIASWRALGQCPDPVEKSRRWRSKRRIRRLPGRHSREHFTLSGGAARAPDRDMNAPFERFVAKVLFSAPRSRRSSRQKPSLRLPRHCRAVPGTEVRRLGDRYVTNDHNLVVHRGGIRKRRKAPKRVRDTSGRTPFLCRGGHSFAAPPRVVVRVAPARAITAMPTLNPLPATAPDVSAFPHIRGGDPPHLRLEASTSASADCDHVRARAVCRQP